MGDFPLKSWSGSLWKLTTFRKSSERQGLSEEPADQGVGVAVSLGRFSCALGV